MAMQLIDKIGNGVNINMGLILSNEDELISILISDDNPKIDEMLETDGISIAFGVYFENNIKTNSHFVTSGTERGGSSLALINGQIIVSFKKDISGSVKEE